MDREELGQGIHSFLIKIFEGPIIICECCPECRDPQNLKNLIDASRIELMSHERIEVEPQTNGKRQTGGDPRVAIFTQNEIGWQSRDRSALKLSEATSEH